MKSVTDALESKLRKISFCRNLKEQYLHRFKLLYLCRLLNLILIVKLDLFIYLYALAGLVGGALLGSK